MRIRFPRRDLTRREGGVEEEQAATPAQADLDTGLDKTPDIDSADDAGADDVLAADAGCVDGLALDAAARAGDCADDDIIRQLLAGIDGGLISPGRRVFLARATLWAGSVIIVEAGRAHGQVRVEGWHAAANAAVVIDQDIGISGGDDLLDATAAPDMHRVEVEAGAAFQPDLPRFARAVALGEEEVLQVHIDAFADGHEMEAAAPVDRRCCTVADEAQGLGYRRRRLADFNPAVDVDVVVAGVARFAVADGLVGVGGDDGIVVDAAAIADFDGFANHDHVGGAKRKQQDRHGEWKRSD